MLYCVVARRRINHAARNAFRNVKYDTNIQHSAIKAHGINAVNSHSKTDFCSVSFLFAQMELKAARFSILFASPLLYAHDRAHCTLGR